MGRARRRSPASSLRECVLLLTPEFTNRRVNRRRRRSRRHLRSPVWCRDTLSNWRYDDRLRALRHDANSAAGGRTRTAKAATKTSGEPPHPKPTAATLPPVSRHTRKATYAMVPHTMTIGQASANATIWRGASLAKRGVSIGATMAGCLLNAKVHVQGTHIKTRCGAARNPQLPLSGASIARRRARIARWGGQCTRKLPTMPRSACWCASGVSRSVQITT